MMNHKPKSSSSSANDSGFTLLESLMAIVILTIMLVGVAPFIVLATATRVQARRVEMATQAARAYIDGVRTGAIPPPNAMRQVNFASGTNNRFEAQSRLDFTNADSPAPSLLPATCQSGNPTTYPYCFNNPTPVPAAANNMSLYCVDYDGGGCSRNSAADMIIQAYRSSSVDPATLDTPAKRDAEIARGYLLSVRVYRADAFANNDPLLKSDRTSTVRQRSSGASLNRKAPLLELTTEISSRTERPQNQPGTTFGDFCDRFGRNPYGGECK